MAYMTTTVTAISILQKCVRPTDVKGIALSGIADRSRPSRFRQTYYPVYLSSQPVFIGRRGKMIFQAHP